MLNTILKNILVEGGNARYIDRETGEDKGFADKMDLTKISRSELIDEMILVLTTINNEFNKKFHEKIWKNFDVITNGTALNGSSASLFNKDITDEEFIKHKPSVGDIDITFPRELMPKLWEFLNTIDNKKLGKMTRYLGHKKSNASEYEVESLHQINAIFEIDTGDYKVNAQIDFEASDYDGDAPTEWATFSHNSDWEDIKSGFKGVLHKYTLLNLARAQSRLEGISVVTATTSKKVSAMTKEEYEAGKPVKASKSKEYVDPTNLAFSVAKGIRTKFAPVFFKDGKEQLMIDSKPVFVLKDSKQDKYTTQLEKQFELIFQKEPTTSDMKNFKSFVGLVKLMKHNLDKKTIENFFYNQLITKTLWCKSGCQGLERNNPEGDLEIKSAMITYLFDNFPYLKSYQSKIDKKIEDYYKAYKMINISESAQSAQNNSLITILKKINDKKVSNND